MENIVNKNEVKKIYSNTGVLKLIPQYPMDIHRVGLRYFQLVAFSFYHESTWLKTNGMVHFVGSQISRYLAIH